MSIFRFIIAATQQLPWCAAAWLEVEMSFPEVVVRTGSTDSITPTRVPPIRISLSWVTRAALGTITETR